MRANNVAKRGASPRKPERTEPGSHQACSTVKFGACSDPEDVLSPLQCVPADVKDGRRVYIHSASFDDLAMQSDVAATMIYSALMALPVIKLIHHDLVEEAVGLGEFDREKADRLERAIMGRWECSVTHTLRCIGVRSQQERSVIPLLGPDESVAATCLDSSYYTFATTENAARRMYADVLKLRKVRALVREGQDAYRDLMMIRGRRLVLVNETGSPDDRRLSREPDRTPSAMSDEASERLKRTMLGDLERELVRIVDVTVPAPTSTEAQRLRSFKAKCVATVSRTILRLPR